ncbi:MAG: adenosylmethionine decarboxylase [Moraxellaceae bacterium]|nr:MAG: adenosylmethionine decarboxylase [Moraxellaceae bacterium]
MSKIKLHGFNNLTKSLSINCYDICFAKTAQHKKEYLQYIDEVYNAERLTSLMENVTDLIGAKILNVARQDYEPQGASVTMLIEDGVQSSSQSSTLEVPGPLPDVVLAHLDKSHLAVHTYPESHPDDGISTFRIDIEVSTCGLISPLRALNYLIHCFDSDIVTLDYRVRGFTRDEEGGKLYIDHEINSIQNYLSEDTKTAYQIVDVNVYQENIFHSKMLVNDFELSNYLFGANEEELSESELEDIRGRLHREMLEIFYGRNFENGLAHNNK